MSASSMSGGKKKPGDSMIKTESIVSQALGGKPLHYTIYLPAGYSQIHKTTYPVVYLLHGIDGNDHSWSHPKLGNVQQTLDQLIGDKAIVPLIAVMPGAKNSWYLDSADIGGPGNYASAIVEDLRLHVEQTYATKNHRPHRAVIGLSMGGFGAVRFGFANADLFSHVGGYSPTLFWFRGDTTRATEAEFCELKQEFGESRHQEFFDENSPYSYSKNLLSVTPPPEFFLVAGSGDHKSTVTYTFELRNFLLRLHVPVEYRVTEGGHSWSVWRWALREHLGYLGKHSWKVRE